MLNKSADKQNYPYIRARGERFGSHASYIESEVQRAKADGAPEDVVSQERNTDGTPGVWKRITDIDRGAAMELRAYAVNRGYNCPPLPGRTPFPNETPDTRKGRREALRTAALGLSEASGRVAYASSHDGSPDDVRGAVPGLISGLAALAPYLTPEEGARVAAVCSGSGYSLTSAKQA